MSEGLSLNTNFECVYGQVEQVSPLIRRIVAPNPGPFTFKGTGTYILGVGEVAIIDPGPSIEKHIDSILEGLKGEKITHQLITHTHVDHSPASAQISNLTGAPTYAFGPHGLGLLNDTEKVEEGADFEFIPDNLVFDGEILEGTGWTVECVHTPGHTSNHICYFLMQENALFSGDHVMGWSTTVISHPDGDMGAYIDSLEKLCERKQDNIYYPTHGAPIPEPLPFVRGLIKHRKVRERQIIELLENSPRVISEIIPIIYKDLDPRLVPAAKRSVFSHIVDLYQRGVVSSEGELNIESTFYLN